MFFLYMRIRGYVKLRQNTAIAGFCRESESE